LKLIFVCGLHSKTDLDCQLTQSRLDLTAIDRQLLDAVDQKLQLSQQLEAWQSDMQDLINIRMAAEVAQDQLLQRPRVSATTAGDGGRRGGERGGVAGIPISTERRKFSLWH